MMPPTNDKRTGLPVKTSSPTMKTNRFLIEFSERDLDSLADDLREIAEQFLPCVMVRIEQTF